MVTLSDHLARNALMAQLERGAFRHALYRTWARRVLEDDYAASTALFRCGVVVWS